MKSIIILVLIFICNTTSFAQVKTDVPAKIKASFLEKHEKATHVNWKKVDSNSCEVSFVEKEQKMSINYDIKGNETAVTAEISQEQLPEAIKVFMRDKGNITKCSSTISADGSQSFSAMAAKKGYIFSNDGDLIGMYK